MVTDSLYEPATALYWHAGQVLMENIAPRLAQAKSNSYFVNGWKDFHTTEVAMVLHWFSRTNDEADATDKANVKPHSC